MSLAERIEERRTLKGWTQAELARRVGVKSTSIWKLASGQSQSSKHLHKIARLLDTSPEYLLGETDNPLPVAYKIDTDALDTSQMPDDHDIVQLREIDLQYGMGARYLDIPVNTEMRTFSREWLRGITKSPPEVLFWASGDGDSMEPTIRAGETFLIDTSQRTPRMNDGIWALALGEIGMVKRLSFQGGGFIELHSDNQLVRPMSVSEDELHIIGRVIAVVRRL
jgi:phage repressor protein C with HTH and peptisase S24 domain